MKYLRANGYQTHIVIGGGQDFVRVYSSRVYGIPPEQVVGTMYSGSRVNLGGALVFGCYSTSVELSLRSKSHRLQCFSIRF
jgi:hypothetical protein